jgi:putative endonuclease
MKRHLLRKFGNENETLAVRFLEEAGFIIVERNYYARKLGEIDIIARKNDVLHFIEVKSARTEFDPIYNITPAKLRRLINSAHYYLKSRNIDSAFVLDALLIRQGEIELIENITI